MMAIDTPERLIPIFDFGGVLLDWSPEYLFAKVIPNPEERKWFLSTVCPPEWNLRMDAGLSYAEAVAERVALFPDQEARIRVWVQRWDDMIARQFDGTARIVEALAETGPIYGLTNFGSESFARTKPRFPVLDRFTDILVSGDVGMVKPDPAIYRAAVQRFGVDPKACFYVDDKDYNLVIPKEMGMQVHQFSDPASLKAWLQGLGQLP